MTQYWRQAAYSPQQQVVEQTAAFKTMFFQNKNLSVIENLTLMSSQINTITTIK